MGDAGETGGTQNLDDDDFHLEEVADESGWARLLCTATDYPSKTIPDSDNEVVIGRTNDCFIPVPLPVVSGKHCKIQREDDDVVFLYDLSTNGTFLNNEKIGKGNRAMLQSGDEITIVQKQGAKIDKVSFVYIYCKEDQAEAEAGGPQSKYVLKQTLGSGAFATVRLAIEKDTGAKFAIKIIDKHKFETSNSSGHSLMDEVNILKKIHHPNIIGIQDVFETATKMYLVLELVTGGELFDRIVSKRRITEDEARPLLMQMLDATDYLHSTGIAHRDLKPENILLNDVEGEMVIKISDFGLSRIIGEGSFMKTVCGTPQYLAPEVLTKAATKGYSKAVDIWSLGVILYTMLAGARPFEETKETTIFSAIKSGKYRFPDNPWKSISEEAKDIIRRMLTVDPSARITARAAMEHPWLASLNANLPERVQEKLVHDEDDDVAAAAAAAAGANADEQPNATSSSTADDSADKPTSPSRRKRGREEESPTKAKRQRKEGDE